ncbi:MAG TPA: chitobiase/beta-hexosaminidase C-terminal domain-containing protein [Bryobacteraceae bacterium]|nr:chitobiase/beta-hexosaminidase C-terminal domain-containing protein [Bryobacteraceae bacterium]
MKTAPRFAVIAKALVGPALWVCATNLLAAALAAQCTNVTQVPNQTISSGTSCYSNNGTLTATGVTINGSASVNFVAGQSIHLGPGFRAEAADPGAAPTTFHAWVETAPSIISVSPSGSSGMNPVFTVTASSPSGYANLTEVQFLLNTTVSGADGCYIRYSGTSLYLADNSGTAWLGGFAPGSAGSASNSYCSISGSGASVSGSGTQLSVTVPVTFQGAFAGAKNQYVIAYNTEGLDSQWQQMGTWTVPAPPPPDFDLTTALNTYSVPLGPSTATYTVTVTPQNGFNSPVSFSATPFYGCWYAVFNPSQVSGPPWTTTLTMSCNEPMPNTYFTTVYASGGGKSHQLTLYLAVAQSQQTYFLSTSVSPSGWGIINPPSGFYNAGTQVMVTAAASPGYQFAGFSGDLTGGSPGYVFMNSYKSVTATFTRLSQVAAPSFGPVSGTYSNTQNVAITTTTSGASIRYTTDGSTPTSTTGMPYTGPVAVASTMTIKAIAYKSGMADSIITTATYTMVVAAPTFSPAAGTYSSTQMVTITSNTTGAEIHYTSDGTNPTLTSPLYSGPVSVSSTTTIKAMGHKSGMTDSTVTSATYTITLGVVAAPSLTPAAGTYLSAQTVTITSNTSGAEIHYTTDGSTPTSSSPLYTGPVSVQSTATIKAIGYKSGMTESSVASAAYVIQGATSTRREYIRVGDRVIAVENVQ